MYKKDKSILEIVANSIVFSYLRQMYVKKAKNQDFRTFIFSFIL